MELLRYGERGVVGGCGDGVIIVGKLFVENRRGGEGFRKRRSGRDGPGQE